MHHLVHILVHKNIIVGTVALVTRAFVVERHINIIFVRSWRSKLLITDLEIVNYLATLWDIIIRNISCIKWCMTILWIIHYRVELMRKRVTVLKQPHLTLTLCHVFLIQLMCPFAEKEFYRNIQEQNHFYNTVLLFLIFFHVWHSVFFITHKSSILISLLSWLGFFYITNSIALFPILFVIFVYRRP